MERESATVTEANAATEVVMLLDTLRMLADQLYTVLMTLVEGESFDILVGSGSGEGLEAWRRLHKRWDPLTTGRARGLLREIFSPGRAKLVELQGAVERLEDLMRRYTQRRDARNGQRHTLAEDIRMAALEALLPEELERHCQLQRSRLDTYEKLREEVVLYAEARGYVAPKLGQVSKAREDRDDPMVVGRYGQWNGRNSSNGKGKNPTGTGKGKGTGKDGKDGAKSSGRVNTPKTRSQCWNCGKTGHQYKDCWVNLGKATAATESRTFKFSWKGKRCEGQTRQRWWKERKIQRCWSTCVESTAESSGELSGIVYTTERETSTTVGTVDAIECTALDLCATALTQQEIVNPRWIAFNVDGAGGTVWPKNADYACEKISGPGGRSYKTARGEMVEGQGRFRVRCQSVWRHLLQTTGEKTSVHKPLMSAGDVTDKGHALRTHQF